MLIRNLFLETLITLFSSLPAISEAVSNFPVRAVIINRVNATV